MFGFHRLSFLIYLFLNWGRICVPGGAYALPTKLLCSDFCYQCEYKAKRKKYLPRYIKSIHGEASHDCDQCKYKAKRKGLLKKHIKSIHGNDKYSCKQCEYKVKQKENLERHIKLIHENVTYPCNQC